MTPHPLVYSFTRLPTPPTIITLLMRVLHLYHDFYPTRGGIEDYLLDLTQAQCAAGHEPIVLTANSTRATVRAQVNGVPVIRAGAYGRYYTPFAPGWFQWLRVCQPDVAHLHLPCPLGEWVMWRARPRRLVVSLHNDYVRPRWALPFHRLLQQAVLRRADAIIVSTADYAQTSPALTAHQANVRIAPYGIALNVYQRLETPIPNPKSVLSAGRLCYYKGIEVLLAAATRIHGQVTIAGDGPWRTRLERQAQRLGVTKHVRFLGAVSEKALITLLQTHRVFVFPSTERSEAFGLMQLKAMACGLPIVSSDLPGVSWLNRHEETGLVAPRRDADALAQAVNELLADEPKRARLAAGAYAHAQQFTIERMAHATQQVYEAAL
jgi:rhamnosyl/mannosyltransferase